MTLPIQKYYDGINNQVYIYEKTKDPVDIKTVIDWVESENKATKVQTPTELLDVIPTRIIRIPVDKKKVLESGTVKPQDSSLIVPYIDIRLKGSTILKSQLIILDILAHNDWKRPIYYVTGYHDDALGLEEYFQLEGLAYRLVPIKSENKNWQEYGRIDTDILYNNLMKKFTWGGANDPKTDIDYNHKRNIMVIKARLDYARLAKALAVEGKKEKAVEVLNYCMDKLPLNKIPYGPYMPDIIEGYFAAGDTAKAVEMTNTLDNHYSLQLDYYLRQTPYIISSAEYEIQSAIQYSLRVAEICDQYGAAVLGAGINRKMQDYYTRYMAISQVTGK